MKSALKIACFGIAFAASSGVQAAQTFDCKITETGWGGWVTDRYIFQVDLAKDKATALDGLINHMFKKPIAAKISSVSDRTIRLKWQVKGIPAMNRATGSSSGNVNLSYTAILNTKTHEVSVRGTVTSGGGAGSSGTSGLGACKVSGISKAISGTSHGTKANRKTSSSCPNTPGQNSGNPACK